MDDYLAKPINARKLAYVLKQWVERDADRARENEVELSTVQDAAAHVSLDAAAFAKLRRLLTDSDPDFLAKSIDSFLDNAAGLIATLRLATELENVEEVYRAAHTLKSSSASYCAPWLSSLCRDLEKTTKDGALDGALQQIARIEAEFANVKRALEAQRS